MFLRRGHREKNYLDSDEIHEMQPRISVSFGLLSLGGREKGKVTGMVMALNDNAYAVLLPHSQTHSLQRLLCSVPIWAPLFYACTLPN